jgi:hypothetical protein
MVMNFASLFKAKMFGGLDFRTKIKSSIIRGGLRMSELEAQAYREMLMQKKAEVETLKRGLRRAKRIKYRILKGTLEQAGHLVLTPTESKRLKSLLDQIPYLKKELREKTRLLTQETRRADRERKMREALEEKLGMRAKIGARGKVIFEPITSIAPAPEVKATTAPEPKLTRRARRRLVRKETEFKESLKTLIQMAEEQLTQSREAKKELKEAMKTRKRRRVKEKEEKKEKRKERTGEKVVPERSPSEIE